MVRGLRLPAVDVSNKRPDYRAMWRSGRPLFSSLLLALVLVACSPTVENESKRWQASIAALDGYAAAHPNFKVAVEEQRAQASVLFEEAKAKGAGEEAAEAMEAANQHLDELLSLFQGVEKKKKEIARLRRDRDLMSVSARVVNPALEAADGAIVYADGVLQEAAPEDAAAAKEVLQQALDRLELGAGGLSRIRDRAARERKSNSRRRRRRSGKKSSSSGRSTLSGKVKTVKGLH